MTSGLVVRSGATAGVSPPETSAPYCSSYGSKLAPSFGAPSPTFGEDNLSSQTPPFQLPSYTVGVSHSSYNMLHATQVAPSCSGTGMMQSVSLGGSPQVGFNMNPSCGGAGTVQSGSLVGNSLANPFLLGRGMGDSSFSEGNRQTGVTQLGGSTPKVGVGVPFQPPLLSGSWLDETANKDNNPFLF